MKRPFAHRWWYHKPSGRTHPFKFHLETFPEGGDEYCNPTIYIGLPFVGAWVIRYKRGPIRTEACAACQAEMGPWCTGCESCHRGPRCHPWGTDCVCRGMPELEDCPACGGTYCTGCEPKPADTCPASRGKTQRSDVTFYRERPYDPNVINYE